MSFLLWVSTLTVPVKCTIPKYFQKVDHMAEVDNQLLLYTNIKKELTAHLNWVSVFPNILSAPVSLSYIVLEKALSRGNYSLHYRVSVEICHTIIYNPHSHIPRQRNTKYCWDEVQKKSALSIFFFVSDTHHVVLVDHILTVIML